MTGSVIAFTGHRPNKLGGYGQSPTRDLIEKRLRSLLDALKPSKCISGMALGFDQWAAQICIDLGIPFVAAIPFKGQELKWPCKSQSAYLVLMAKAIDVKVVCEGPYAAWKMQERNKWMVDQADEIIACFDGSPGGTANCLAYARLLGKTIHIIDPTLADE